MSFKWSEDVEVESKHNSLKTDVFTVTVTTRFLLFNKPHAVVLPALFAGKFTKERGFMIEFTTSAPEILMAWHKILTQEIVDGKYEEMVRRARIGIFPIEDDDPELMATVKGFRCS